MATSPSSVRGIETAPPSGSTPLDSYWGDRAPVAIARVLSSVFWQAIVIGVAVLVIALVSAGFAALTMSLTHASLIAVAVAGAYWFLREAIQVTAWVATTCTALYVCHPLTCAATFGTTGASELFLLAVIPLGLGLARYAVMGGAWRGLGLGLLIGTALAVDRVGGGVFAVVILFYIIADAAISQRFSKPSRTRLLKSMAIATVAAGIAAFVVPGVFAYLGIDLPETSAATPADATAAITAPLALVDRDGLLADRLRALPDDLVNGGGKFYLGWSVIVLALIGVWPAKASVGRGRGCVLLALAFLLTWAMRGDASLHEQLKRLFEFATVRRYVEPVSLNLLGAAVIPLALLAGSGFLAVRGLFSGSRRATLPVLILASFAVMAWWATSLSGVASGAGGLSTVLADAPATRLVLAFCLIGSVAVGLQRLTQKSGRRHWRVLLAIAALGLITIDIVPYVQLESIEAPAAMRRSAGGSIAGS